MSNKTKPSLLVHIDNTAVDSSYALLQTVKLACHDLKDSCDTMRNIMMYPESVGYSDMSRLHKEAKSVRKQVDHLLDKLNKLMGREEQIAIVRGTFHKVKRDMTYTDQDEDGPFKWKVTESVNGRYRIEIVRDTTTVYTGVSEAYMGIRHDMDNIVHMLNKNNIPDDISNITIQKLSDITNTITLRFVSKSGTRSVEISRTHSFSMGLYLALLDDIRQQLVLNLCKQ